MKNFFFGTLLLTTMHIQAQQFDNTINIIQNETINSITSEISSIEIKKEPFRIQFDNKFYNSKKEYHYATRITFLNPEDEVDLIEEGMIINQIPYFEIGTGFSTDEDGSYSTAIINSYGHHYLYYENELDHRVTLISKNKGLGKFELAVNRFYFNDRDIPISKFNKNNLKMVILTDINQNYKIDENELRIINIKFQK